ncbi:MAG: LamB/YcsF family protein [Dehalococcoidia bacterium]|nr:LamB/YcsF family protein [Dehalococcoidia bacterium]
MSAASTQGRVDFNSDIGESFGSYKMGLDEEVIGCISSANIACGFHAGDPGWMRHTVGLAEKNGVGIGAHPAFPDLRGFGRRNMVVDPQEARDDVVYQIGALTAFTRGKRLQHVKPHGAMYNMAVKDEVLARAICEAILEVDQRLILLALSGSRWIEIAEEMGLRVAREVFADRALMPDGTLAPRSRPGAVLHDADQIAERTLRMVTEGTVEAVDGSEVEVVADSICLHGDTPGAVAMARAVRDTLEGAGVRVVPLEELV